jgi:hypothetical protein
VGADLTQYIPLPHSRADPKLSGLQTEARVVGREYAPVPGKWFENKEEEETFRVLSVDEDDELVEIEYLDGEIEELDLDTWHELDLEPTDEPEGWSDDADDGEEEEEDDEDFDDDEDEDEDEDDEDDDDFDDEEENENY